MKKKVIDKINEIKRQKKIIMLFYKERKDTKFLNLHSDYEKLEYLLVNYYKELIKTKEDSESKSLNMNIKVIFKIVDDSKSVIDSLDMSELSNA